MSLARRQSVRSLAIFIGAALLAFAHGAAAQTTCPGSSAPAFGSSCAALTTAATLPNAFANTPGLAATSAAPGAGAPRLDPGADDPSTVATPPAKRPSSSDPTYGSAPSINPRMEAPPSAYGPPAQAPADPKPGQ